MAKQAVMFEDGSDLPLFSGTCKRVKVLGKLGDQLRAEQLAMAKCKVCLDTGWFRVHKGGRSVRCSCGAGYMKWADEEVMMRVRKVNVHYHEGGVECVMVRKGRYRSYWGSRCSVWRLARVCRQLVSDGKMVAAVFYDGWSVEVSDAG